MKSIISSSILILFWFFISPHKVYGYSSGAPKGACLSMKPNHDGQEPQQGKSYHHFTIVKDGAYVYGPGDKVNISLFVPDSSFSKFKGFMIQARNTIDDKIIGHFETDDPKVQLKDCDAQESNTLTHVNADKKERITASWVVPQVSGEKKVKFYYTVVEEKPKFWVKQDSPEIILNSSSNTFSASIMLVSTITAVIKML